MVDAKRCGGSGWGRDRENGLAEGREAFDGLTVKQKLRPAARETEIAGRDTPRDPGQRPVGREQTGSRLATGRRFERGRHLKTGGREGGVTGVDGESGLHGAADGERKGGEGFVEGG